MVRQVCFYLTKHCNLSCSYCNITKTLQGQDMGLEQVKKALKIIKDVVKTEFLVLFGGEPLTRKDISEIVDEVNRLDFKYTLISNGTIDNENVIKKLKGLTLSIDRIDSYIGDKNELAKSNWTMLEKYKDIVPDLVANITVTHENVDELEAIVDKLNGMGIWIIFGLVHSTRDKDEKAMFRSYCPKLMINRDDFELFRKAFYKAEKRHNTKFYVEYFERYFNQMNWHCKMNPRNPEYLTISNDGTFLACSDHWGSRVINYNIFQLPTIGIDNWSRACSLDREDCQLTCFLNHEIQLAYPDEGNYLCH